jgi:DNA-binding FrmR family transcriptional regulator
VTIKGSHSIPASRRRSPWLSKRDTSPKSRRSWRGCVASDEEQYCIDILTQVSAATKALEGVALLLLDQHLDHCLTQTTDAAQAQQKLNEASAAIRRLVRS